MSRLRFILLFVMASICVFYPPAIALANLDRGTKSPEFSREIISRAQESAYPAAFLGSEWAYGFALFSMIFISAMTARYLLIIISNMRDNPDDIFSPATLGRALVLGLLSTILMVTLPEAVMLLAWGEVNPNSIVIIGNVRRVMQGLIIIPFGLSMLAMLRGREVLQYALSRQTEKAIQPDIDAIKYHVALILVVAVIALGVTIGK